jgi:hypothetical protein
MTAADWAGLAVSITTLIGATAIGVRFLVKSYLSELKPNGGDSLNDTIKLQVLPILQEVQKDVNNLKFSMGRLEGRFDQHVEEAQE